VLATFRKMMVLAIATAALAVPVTTASATPADQGTQTDQVQPRTENLQFHLWLTNLNNDWLNVDHANNSWGKWCDSDGQKPEAPRPVPPNADTYKSLCSQGRENSPSGATGEVKYVFKNDPSKWFTISWNVPWGSSTNEMGYTSAKKVFIQCNDFKGRGKVEKVTCKVASVR
jgi:hypothetical protein